MINKHVTNFLKYRGSTLLNKRTKLRGMRRIRFNNAKSRIKRSRTYRLLKKVITMLLLRRTSKLLSVNKSTNYKFRGGFVQCHVSNQVIYDRIISLLENNVSDSSEMLKLVRLSKHINKNGNIKWNVYFFRRSRYLSGRVHISGRSRSLQKLKRKLWFTKKKKFTFSIKRLGLWYYFLETRRQSALYKKKKKKKKTRSYNLYERCIMELNRVAVTGRRMYKLKMRFRLGKEVKQNKNIYSIYKRRIKDSFEWNILVRRRVFGRMLKRLVNKHKYATNMLESSRRWSVVKWVNRDIRAYRSKYLRNRNKYRYTNRHVYRHNKNTKESNIGIKPHQKIRTYWNKKNRTYWSIKKKAHYRYSNSKFVDRMFWYKLRGKMLKNAIDKRRGIKIYSHMSKMRMHGEYINRRRHSGIYNYKGTYINPSLHSVKNAVLRALSCAYICVERTNSIKAMRIFSSVYNVRTTNLLDSYMRLIVSTQKRIPVMYRFGGGAFVDVTDMNAMYSTLLRACELVDVTSMLLLCYSELLSSLTTVFTYSVPARTHRHKARLLPCIINVYMRNIRKTIKHKCITRRMLRYIHRKFAAIMRCLPRTYRTPHVYSCCKGSINGYMSHKQESFTYSTTLYKIALMLELVLGGSCSYTNVSTATVLPRKQMLSCRYRSSAFLYYISKAHSYKNYAMSGAQSNSTHTIDSDYVHQLHFQKRYHLEVKKIYRRKHFESRVLKSLSYLCMRIKRLSRVNFCLRGFYKHVRIRKSLNNCLSRVERYSLRHWMFRKLLRIRKKVRRYFSRSRRRGTKKWYLV